VRHREKHQRRHAIIIGNLKIDFDIVIGNLDKSVYRGDEIEINWSEHVFTPSEPIPKIMAKRWSELCKQAQQKGQILVDSKLARLVDYSETSNKITLILQPTSYRVFSTTNLGLDHQIPRQEGEGYMSIRELSESEGSFLTSPYLANPLNVIAMIITNDDFTYTPMRSSLVFESPNTLQASVGGAVNPREHPTSALIREITEEWGLLVEEDEIRFLVLGINQRTGEPDLIAMVDTELSASEVLDVFKTHNQKEEFTEPKPIKLSEKNLGHLLSTLYTEQWSQPSDQAAFLITLIRRFGIQAIEMAIM
jgi:ADP-ribose pyrophosphatase YjhB (NUDIX family)